LRQFWVSKKKRYEEVKERDRVLKEGFSQKALGKNTFIP